MGAKIFLSHTFHVRNKYLRTHLKLSPAFCFLDGATTSMTIFSFSVIYPKYFNFIILLTLSLRERARSFVPALFYRRPWHTHPSCPKSEKIRWVSGGSRQKGYWRVAGVSALRSDPAATRKAHGITSKTHLLSPSIFIILLTLSLSERELDRSFLPSSIGDHSTHPPPVQNQKK